jgi:hypothetical protein
MIQFFLPGEFALVVRRHPLPLAKRGLDGVGSER